MKLRTDTTIRLAGPYTVEGLNILVSLGKITLVSVGGDRCGISKRSRVCGFMLPVGNAILYVSVFFLGNSIHPMFAIAGSASDHRGASARCAA